MHRLENVTIELIGGAVDIEGEKRQSATILEMVDLIANLFQPDSKTSLIPSEIHRLNNTLGAVDRAIQEKAEYIDLEDQDAELLKRIIQHTGPRVLTPTAQVWRNVPTILGAFEKGKSVVPPKEAKWSK